MSSIKVSIRSRLKAANAPLDEVIEGEDRSYGSTLYVDLVPRGAWYSNVRAITSPTDWRRLSTMVRKRADYTCEACGHQGKPYMMDCHERWRFEHGVQRLTQLVCLCKACHEVTHMGLARVNGREWEATKHLEKVTGMGTFEAWEHIDEAFETWARRSEQEWRLDVSLLDGVIPYEVDEA